MPYSYKIVDKYQLGYRNDTHINIALVETMADNRDANNLRTIVHYQDNSYLVLADLSEQYKLPAHVKLYRIQTIKNFIEFKESGDAILTRLPQLFMMNTNTGMWDYRRPDAALYADAQTAPQAESDCVQSMRGPVVYAPNGNTESYITPVQANIPRKVAHSYERANKHDYALRSAERAFNLTMAHAAKTMIVRKSR